jgi:hypothetical protein
MADYNAQVYIEQGGKRLVVASSGSLDVESGGEIDIESGGSLKIAGTAISGSAANLNRLTSDLAIETVNNADSSTDGSTSFSDLAAAGISLLSCTGSTASSLCGFRLQAPVAGLQKTLAATAGIDATHDAIVEVNSTDVTLGYAAGKNHRMAFDAVDEVVVLRGVSATKWAVVSNVGGVAFSTSFTT